MSKSSKSTNEKHCRAAVQKRALNACERCGKRCGPPSCHHRLKRSQGGKWTVENIVLVGGSGVSGCHGWIEAHPKEADLEGFHVRPWEDPATKPVLVHGKFWALLSDEYRHVDSVDNR